MHEGHRERMRDKLFADEGSLTDHELLEILLYYCIDRRDTNPVAHSLLEAFCDLSGVLEAPVALLGTLKGVGTRTAEFLSLVGTVYRRIRAASSRPRFFNFSDTGAFIARRFKGAEKEKLELYCLNERGEMTYLESVRDTSFEAVRVNARFISFLLSQMHPYGLIVAHNHPSGDMHPSEEDDAAVCEIGRLCAANGTRLCDSVVYTEKGSFSYYCSGRLERLLGGYEPGQGGRK